MRLIGFLFLVLAITPGCSKHSSSRTNAPVVAYCSTPTHYPDFVAVSGTAQYESIALDLSSCDTNSSSPTYGTCPYLTTDMPVRYAEVRVYNSEGNLTQCGETLVDGTYSVQLPRATGTYNITVTSRSNNSHLQVYVLNNIYQNTYHQISVSVDSSTALTGQNILAPADINSSREGGAFNILDQLLNANNFLRQATASTFDNVNRIGGCGNAAYYPDCKPFSVGPLAYAYWAKGANAGTNAGYAKNGGSFYIPGTNNLFIRGGNDDTDISDVDTDEYDDSVIIHEYGHFLEDNYAHSDSPGGYHTGTVTIDPRLAWSEGWADFFQAAVLNNPRYFDTENAGVGRGSIYIDFNLETATNDFATNPGEGIFREFSVSRALWDAIDNTPNEVISDGTNAGTTTDSVYAPFSEVWSVFSSSTTGFRNSSYNFRNVGLLNKLHSLSASNFVTNGGSSSVWSDFTVVQTAERQPASLQYYSAPLVSGSTTSTTCSTAQSFSISPTGSFSINKNEAFYGLNVSSPHSTQINVTYLTPITNSVSLDLFMYKKGYSYYNCSASIGCTSGSPYAIRAASGVLASTTARTTTTPSDSDCVAISGGVLSAGCGSTYNEVTMSLASYVSDPAYLFNLSADGYSGGTSYYTMTLDGQAACIAP